MSKPDRVLNIVLDDSLQLFVEFEDGSTAPLFTESGEKIYAGFVMNPKFEDLPTKGT